MTKTRRAATGICLAFLLAACGSSGSGSSGTGGSSKQGGTSGNPSGGTAGNPSGGTSGSAKGGAGGSPAGGTTGSSSGGTTGDSSGGTSGGTTSSPKGGAGGGPTGGTSGSSNGGTTGTATGGTTGSTLGGTTGTATGGTTTTPTGGSTTGKGGATGGGTTTAGATGTATGGRSGGSTGQGTGGQAGSTGGGGTVSGCVSSKTWPTADATKAGPFQITSEKKVGPLAGYTPDPVYGDQQQQFNIYRPANLDDGYCHPILVWSNGHGDNPEQNGPCVIDKAADKWCGQYKPVLDHLASHGFVVIASLSTTTSKSDPKTGLLPSIMGLEWLLAQAEDSKSAYYHRLDTTHIGAFGHSEGGMTTCMMAKDPRFSAISTVSGTSTISTIYMPAVFFCGSKETNFDPPMCDSNLKVASTITTQPSMLINALDEDHGSWAYDGASGVAISGFAAWFRLHLMGDTAQRKRFYGDGCNFCTDNRVKVLYRNSLMTQ